LLVDFLGFGLSDKPENFSYTLKEHAGTLVRLLDHLGLRGCQVIAHSLGGSVAVLLADLRPDLVSFLVLAEANLDPGAGPMSGAIVQQSEMSYIVHGFQDDLARLRERARSGVDSVPPVVFGDAASDSSARHAPHCSFARRGNSPEDTRVSSADEYASRLLGRLPHLGGRTQARLR
jgi:pimeloyl-ACP methyl ester carboxylesterase